MVAFTLTPAGKGIMRCKHTDAFSPEDVQALEKFLEDYRRKLLVDLSQTNIDECIRNIKNFRPIMPTTAIFGAPIGQEVLNLPESYYEKDVRFFKTEQEALDWLHDQ